MEDQKKCDTCGDECKCDAQESKGNCPGCNMPSDQCTCSAPKNDGQM